MVRFRRWAVLAAAGALAASSVVGSSVAASAGGNAIAGIFLCAANLGLADDTGDPIIETSDHPAFNGDLVSASTTRPWTGAYVSADGPPGANDDANRELWLSVQKSHAGPPFQATVIPGTDTTGDNGFGPPAISDPRANSKGAVVISATADLVGGNGDHNAELFQIERPHSGGVDIFQLTDTTDGPAVLFPAVNDSVSRVFVPMVQDFGENPSGRPQLQVIDNTPGGGIDQVTSNDGNHPITDVTVNDAGTVGTFISTGNLTGSNADHSAELYRFFLASGVWATQQVTNGTFEVRDAVISGNGLFAAFTANANLAGDNIGNTRVLFKYALLNNAVQQVTEAGLNVSVPDIDTTGNRILYVGDGDPLGFNPGNHQQLWAWDARGPVLDQITRSTGGVVGRPSMNDEGTMFAFPSTANLGGRNPGGENRLFYGVCGPRPRLFSDVPLTHPGFGPIGGLRSAGVLGGFSDGTFRPGQTMSRGEFSLAVLRAAGNPVFTVGNPVFSDVPRTSRFFRAAQFLHREYGIGGQGSRFRPNDPASRRESAKWTSFFLGEDDPPTCTTSSFTDLQVTDPFCRFIETLVRRGVVDAGGRYRPTAAMTRYTVARLLMRAMKVR